MPPAELSEFPVVVPWPVQWGDQDSFGHVNNTIYFRWVETARIVYLEKINLSETAAETHLEPILAAINCNFRKQVHYPDTIHIGVRVTRVGRSSIAMAHKLWSERQQAVIADGDSTVVVFDYSTNHSCPVPEGVRQAISRLEHMPVEGLS